MRIGTRRVRRLTGRGLWDAVKQDEGADEKIEELIDAVAQFLRV
jgi:hypothetical protein